MTKEQFFKVATPFRIILSVAVISIIFNIWFFGGRWLNNERQKYLQAGAGQTIEQIFSVIKQQGWISIKNSAGETIKLEVAK